jgi:hypothetical protein
MTVGTRYLVLGKVPEGIARTKHSEGFNNMIKEAMTMGIETIPLDQFLDQMGYRPDARAVRLGAGASARDFPARSASEARASSTSVVPPQFRPRVPPAAESTSTPK